MLNIAMIGVGGMGYTHLCCMKALAEELPIQVVAIADRLEEHRQRAAEQFPNARLYSEGADLLRDGTYDVVYILTPSYEHTALILQAAETVHNIFSEKPVCLTKAECDALVQMQETRKPHFMVGQVVRSMPEYIYLKQIIEEETYGALKTIVAQRISCKPTWGYENWFMDAERSGSVVLDLHIHDLDFLRYALGDPDSAEPVLVSRFDTGMINHIVTHLTYGQVNVIAEGVWHTSSSLPFSARFRADFEHATVDFDSARKKDKLVVYTEQGERILPLVEEEERTIDSKMNITSLGAYLIEDRYFLHSILDGTPNEIAPLMEGIKSVQLCHKIMDQA